MCKPNAKTCWRERKTSSTYGLLESAVRWNSRETSFYFFTIKSPCKMLACLLCFVVCMLERKTERKRQREREWKKVKEGEREKVEVEIYIHRESGRGERGRERKVIENKRMRVWMCVYYVIERERPFSLQ